MEKGECRMQKESGKGCGYVLEIMFCGGETVAEQG
jgi:hypothetical protein